VASGSVYSAINSLFVWLSCRYTGTYTKCLNLGSYNYLGFAEASGPCADASVAALNMYGCAMCSPIQELGKSSAE